MSGSTYSTREIRTRAIEALSRGMSMVDVASAYQVDRTTLFRWRQRYDAEGEAGLQRRGGSGRPRKLTEMADEMWYEIVLQPASAFGFETDLWTLKRIAQVIRLGFGVSYHPGHVWKVLGHLGWSCQRPERKARERNEDAIKRWVRYRWPRIKKRPATAGRC